MRTIQEIFNAVIESGFYSEQNEYKSDVEDNWQPYKNSAMCIAIVSASKHQIITPSEYKKAKKEITSWLKELDNEINYWNENFDDSAAYLESALQACDIRYDFEFRKAIYLNWDKRPNLALIYRQMMQARSQ